MVPAGAALAQRHDPRGRGRGRLHHGVGRIVLLLLPEVMAATRLQAGPVLFLALVTERFLIKIIDLGFFGFLHQGHWLLGPTDLNGPLTKVL